MNNLKLYTPLTCSVLLALLHKLNTVKYQLQQQQRHHRTLVKLRHIKSQSNASGILDYFTAEL